MKLQLFYYQNNWSTVEVKRVTFPYLPKQNTSCKGQFIIFPDNISIDKQQKHSGKLSISTILQFH